MGRLTGVEIDKYIGKFTTKANPHCTECDDIAEYNDSGAGEVYCYSCLVESLNRDPEEVREMLNKNKGVENEKD